MGGRDGGRGAGLCTCQGVMSGVSNIQPVLCRLEIQREVALIFQLRSWETLICRYSEHLQTLTIPLHFRKENVHLRKDGVGIIKTIGRYHPIPCL